jgi:predicted DNA binding CopG/RHH family protein
MQTTLRINNHLYRRAKAKSSQLGVSLTRFLEEALETRLERIEAKSSQQIRLPISTAKGEPLSFAALKQRISEAEIEQDFQTINTSGLP